MTARVILTLEPHLRDELDLDNPENYKRAVRAFFLGYGVSSVRELLKLPAHDISVREVMRVAPLIGFRDGDCIQKRKE
jgi:hypothetical protein